MTAGDSVRVIYGADEVSSEHLVEKTVASVRRSFAGPFGISSQALPYIRGHKVGEVYRLQSSDVLEFLVGWGHKGGLSPEDMLFLEREALTLAAAAKLFPGRKPGKKVSIDTIWRWCMRGLRNGVRLKSVLIGGQRYTTKQWIKEFIEAMTDGAEPGAASTLPVRTPNQKRSAAERATDELKSLWNQKRPS
jgi:hypothetical protein